MKSGAVVREILWEIEKSVAKTKSDEVSAVSINILNFFPLFKSGAVVREILWEIEKSVAKTKSDEVSAVSINILNFFPLF